MEERKKDDDLPRRSEDGIELSAMRAASGTSS
jgi:hypothetical protein